MSDKIKDYVKEKSPSPKCDGCEFIGIVSLCQDASCVEDDGFYIFKLKDKSKGESDE